MQKRKSVLGVGLVVGVVGVLTTVSGCVGPAESEEPAVTLSETQEPAAEPEGEMVTVSQSVNTTENCNYAAAGNGGLKEAQKRATKALKYILGTNNVGEQSCSSSVRDKLNTIRNAIASGDLNIVATQSSLICNTVSAKRITMKQNTLTTGANGCIGTLWNAIHDLAKKGGELDTCFGQGTSTFFVLQTYYRAEGGKWRNYVQFDPEPANLTANLASGYTGSAAAVFGGGEPTTAYRFGTGYTSCGTGPTGGLPCTSSSGSLSNGTVLNQTLVKKGSLCKCN